MMVRVIVGSKNPVKIKAAGRAFRKVFPDLDFTVLGTKVPSKVPDQPEGDEETLLGASNRVSACFDSIPDADYWVGIEGGIDFIDSKMCTYAWIVVRDKIKEGRARTGTFFLSKEVSDLVKAGKELGDADDIVFGRSNSKQENGAVGILTGNLIDRAALYEHACILALVPFRNRLDF